MSAPHCCLSPSEFAKVFPFHVALDRELRVIQTGQSVAKVCPEIQPGVLWKDVFEVVKPALASTNFDDYVAQSDAVFLVQRKRDQLKLRGQFLLDSASGHLFFLGSPWMTSLKQLEAFDIDIRDFAIHDAAADFLFLLRSKEMGLADAKKLAEKLRLQSEDLSHAKRLAEAANEAKSTFLAKMSHELRTPLNGVVGMAGLMLQGPLSHEQREYISIIHHSAMSLVSIIDDILDFSRLEAGMQEVEETTFEPVRVVSDVVNILQGQAQQKKLRLLQRVSASVPEKVRGDATKIRQVLLNLVGNGIKFTHKGEVEVRAEICGQRDGQNLLRFEVADTGVGISQETRDRIFEAFSQGDDSATRKFGGTGLGLAISKQFVELMDGTIDCMSVPGQGSVFSFVIPVRKEREVPSTDEAPTVETPTEGGAVDFESVRVLVAEDNPINQKVVAKMLSKLGCRVTLAGDGAEAVREVMQRRYDLVLMDYQMPTLNGLDATAQIRQLETGPRVPIVAMTANASAKDREACLASGMDDFVAKPVTLEKMTDIVSRWAGKGATASH